jgi:hypothetical protein
MTFTSCFAHLRRRGSKATRFGCHLALKATVPKRSVPAAGWARAAGAKLPPRHRRSAMNFRRFKVGGFPPVPGNDVLDIRDGTKRRLTDFRRN